MSPSRRPDPPRAFALLEVMIALAVVAVLLGAISIPLATQAQLRRQEDTRRILDEARDALLGFVAAQGRLPCPSLAGARGMESFAQGGDAGNGECADFHAGYLPAAALGMSPLDAEGFLRDAWQGPRNLIRYAVFGDGATINGVRNALTRAEGMRSAGLAGLGAAPHYLFICTTGAQAGPGGCGPAVNQLTRRAAVVLVSAGANASTPPPPGSDEARNLDGDASFVSHEASNVPGSEFDDVVQWVPIHAVINRLVVAGRLP
jgi:prepilin-type N-terminal cleavage/methylation domain-containing protein